MAWRYWLHYDLWHDMMDMKVAGSFAYLCFWGDM
jgi:hypothetical protein